MTAQVVSRVCLFVESTVVISCVVLCCAVLSTWLFVVMLRFVVFCLGYGHMSAVWCGSGVRCCVLCGAALGSCFAPTEVSTSTCLHPTVSGCA